LIFYRYVLARKEARKYEHSQKKEQWNLTQRRPRCWISQKENLKEKQAKISMSKEL
jgi:hypothetical protein